MLCSMLGVSQRVFQNTICSPWGNMSPFGMCSIFYNLSSILVTESDDTLDIYSKISSVQSLSCVWLFVTPWTAERLASLSITNSQSSPKPMSIESVMPSNHLILCHPLLLLLRGASSAPAKVLRKEAWHTQRRDRASGVSLEILKHLPPKPESAYFLLCAFTYTSDFTGGCPPLPLSEKSISLQLQLVIPGCDSVSTYKLLWKSSSLPE